MQMWHVCFDPLRSCSLEVRKWARRGRRCGWVQRREEVTEGGEKEEWRVPPTCYQFVPPSWPHWQSQRQVERVRQKSECVHVWERKRTSLNECTLIHQHDKERSCCIHGLFPFVVARYVSRASVWLVSSELYWNAGMFVVIKPRRSAERYWNEELCKVTRKLQFQNMPSWIS